MRLAALGMGQDVGRGLHRIGAQVGQLAQLDPAPQARLLTICDRHTLVKTLVAQLLEILRSDVVVESVPAVNEVGKMERPEIEVGEQGEHPHNPGESVAHSGARQISAQRPPRSAQPARLRGHGRLAPRPQLVARLARHPAIPPDEEQAEQSQHQLPARAGVVVPVVEELLGRRHGGGRIHHLHGRRKRRGHPAIGRNLGCRVEAIANPLAEAEVARRPFRPR